MCFSALRLTRIASENVLAKKNVFRRTVAAASNGPRIFRRHDVAANCFFPRVSTREQPLCCACFLDIITKISLGDRIRIRRHWHWHCKRQSTCEEDCHLLATDVRADSSKSCTLLPQPKFDLLHWVPVSRKHSNFRAYPQKKSCSAKKKKNLTLPTRQQSPRPFHPHNTTADPLCWHACDGSSSDQQRVIP